MKKAWPAAQSPFQAEFVTRTSHSLHFFTPSLAMLVYPLVRKRIKQITQSWALM